MEEPIVKVENLSHRYSVQWAIKDINFEITKNGIYGLLGSNGAGKSTTMNIMCGVLKQTEGNIFIKGINMREQPVRQFTDPRLFKHILIIDVTDTLKVYRKSIILPVRPPSLF